MIEARRMPNGLKLWHERSNPLEFLFQGISSHMEHVRKKAEMREREVGYNNNNTRNVKTIEKYGKIKLRTLPITY